MTVAIGDILRVIDKGAAYGQGILNIYHMITSGTGSLADSTVLNAIKSWLESVHFQFYNSISDQYDFDSVDVINVTQDTYVGTAPYTAYTEGLSTDDMLPLQMAAVARFPTATLGSQGRKFTCGFSEASSQDGGVLASLALSRWVDGVAEMLDGWSVSGMTGTPGNYHPTLLYFRPWTSGIANSILGTQRRRKIGVGT